LINNGFRDELNACIQPIEYICKKIVDFWMRYKRKKSSILQYESDWLTITESILLKNRKNVPQENAESAPRGRKKLNFMKS